MRYLHIHKIWDYVLAKCIEPEPIEHYVIWGGFYASVWEQIEKRNMCYWLAFVFAQFDACIQDLVRCVALTKLVFGARHLKLAQAHIRLAKAYLKFKGNHQTYRENQMASVWSRANSLQTPLFHINLLL